MKMHPALVKFIDEVHAIIDEEHEEHVITQRVAGRLTALVAVDAVLPIALMQPGADHYVMYPVYVAPDGRFSIASAVWGIGQQTPIHDHGVWGVIGIVQGVEHEIRFDPPSEGVPVKKIGDHLIGEKEVVICCTSDNDVHQVSCASDIPCVGFHVYGGDIGQIERRSYNPDTGQVKTFVSRWAVPNLN